MPHDSYAAFVVGNLLPHQRLAGLEAKLLAEGRRHGNLTAFGKGSEQAFHLVDIIM